VRERLTSYVYFTAYHPANLRAGALNAASAPLFSRYGARLPKSLRERLAAAHIVVLESTPGLMLAPAIRRANPSARMVYRVSDDLRLLKNHPVVLEAERRLASRFDLISVPTPSMVEIFPGASNLAVQPHGLQTDLFDTQQPNPYATDGPHAVFAGNSHFDYDFLERAARLLPKWTFHILGPIPALPVRPNVVPYGEVPFHATIPYLQHADAGLQARAYSPGAESLADSLKVLQYTYCGLGIVAPDFLRSARPNVFTYKPGDDASTVSALEAAAMATARGFERSDVWSWDELAARLAA
jgi:2-beta-glucuronyltransferase